MKFLKNHPSAVFLLCAITKTPSSTANKADSEPIGSNGIRDWMEAANVTDTSTRLKQENSSQPSIVVNGVELKYPLLICVSSFIGSLVGSNNNEVQIGQQNLIDKSESFEAFNVI